VPNETVEKKSISEKSSIVNKGAMASELLKLGFFDSLNKGVQATAYNVYSSLVLASRGAVQDAARQQALVHASPSHTATSAASAGG
jgi:hypothetical protein